MNLDKNLWSMFLALLLGLTVPAGIYFWKLPRVKTAPAQQELINFSYQPATVTPPKPQTAFSGLQCPVRTAAPKPAESLPAGRVFARGRTAQPARENPSPRLPVVSMVYSDGFTMMAIVDGQVLRQGSSLGRHQIIKIEDKRVLLRSSGKDLWLNIE